MMPLTLANAGEENTILKVGGSAEVKKHLEDLGFVAAQGFRTAQNAPRVEIAPPFETPPVSPCKPLCAIFLRKPSVYPLSGVKANVGRLCEKLKSVMRSGLKQRCDGNFLTIFVGMGLDEKPNFLSRIFG